MITVSPALVLRAWHSTALGVGWSSFVNAYPVNPDNVVAFYRVPGFMDTHSMNTGVRTVHPGISVRVRAGGIQSDPTAYAKTAEIWTLLEQLNRAGGATVVVGLEAVRIWAFDFVSDIIGMGYEDQDRRYSYTFTGNLTLSPGG